MKHRRHQWDYNQCTRAEQNRAADAMNRAIIQAQAPTRPPVQERHRKKLQYCAGCLLAPVVLFFAWLFCRLCWAIINNPMCWMG